MKHARDDYNRIQDPANIIPDDEPVFLLRAQDVTAPGVVLEWAKANIAIGGDPGLIDAAINHALRMLDWQQAHKRKIADGIGETKDVV